MSFFVLFAPIASIRILKREICVPAVKKARVKD
jgi:hypothetical protein